MARGVITNSSATLRELEAFAAHERLPMPRAIAAPLATGLERREAAPRPLAEPYFVALGTIEPRKNHRLLLDVWRQLGAEAPRLVVVGQRGWLCEDVVEALHQQQATVLWKEHCSDAELAAWLRHARALLMPSHVEGYGLPVAEALAAGVPVIASELAVFRDSVGGVPDYADPERAAQWLELVRDYAGAQSARRAAQLERLARFRPSTWAEHFRAVHAFLDSLAGELAFEA